MNVSFLNMYRLHLSQRLLGTGFEREHLADHQYSLHHCHPDYRHRHPDYDQN